MKFFGILICIALFGATGLAQKFPCLPSGITESTVVRVDRRSAPVGGGKKITVRQTLKTLKAKCEGGQLIDRTRKLIKFFRFQGCWGNPPMDYLEIRQRQAKELADLKKKYTVIEMSCDIGDTPAYLIK